MIIVIICITFIKTFLRFKLHMNSQANLDQLEGINPSIRPAKKTQQKSLISYRLMIFYRFILATFGGYLLAALSAVVIAKVFSDYRASAVMSATLFAFAIHTAAFIWVFMVNKTLKATLGIMLPILFLFIINLVSGT